MLSIRMFSVILFCFLIQPLLAQQVSVKTGESSVGGEKVTGFTVDLEGKAEEIDNAFTKYLKSLGRARQNDGVITVTESTINGNTYKLPVYGKVTEKGAWIGVKKNEWAQGYDEVNKDLEKLMYSFGVKFYRDKIQVQVDESTRAQTAVEKQQQRLITQQRDLNMKLEDNKREKIQLEKALVGNADEYGKLLKKIEKNKHDQDSMKVVNEQVKKVVESHKERQLKVN